MSTTVSPSTIDCAAVAEHLVRARVDGTALATFPGPQPTDLATAYRCQDAAIARWNDRIVGWKVGGIPVQQQATLGATRLIGPVFSRGLRIAGPGPAVEFPVFVGGFAAVEAEIVFRLGLDAPQDCSAIDAAAAMALVDSVFAGVETAGSPMARINLLGPTAVVCDFGNNHGLIVGPRIGGCSMTTAPIGCRTRIDDELVGEYRLPNGLLQPAQALAFAVGLCASRGRPLRKGDFVTTGALTGIHEIRPGQRAVVAFDGYPPIVCHAVPLLSARMGT